MTPRQAVDYLVNYESIPNDLPAFLESGIFKGFEAEMDEKLRGKAEHATIDGFREDDVISGTQQTKNGIDACHA